MSPRDLPHVNAVLNATSAVLLSLGYLQIRSGRRNAHRACMIAAVVTSTLFLVSYVFYHLQVGSVPYNGHGPMRSVYYAILISHVLLAVAIIPLVIVTLARALRERFDTHRRLARVTLPLWGYVSVTGVLVYWMLYRA